MNEPASVTLTDKRPSPNEREPEPEEEEKKREPRHFRVRRNCIETVNEALTRVAAAEKRFNDAKANLGTAERELRDARHVYHLAYNNLMKNLPDPVPPRGS